MSFTACVCLPDLNCLPFKYWRDILGQKSGFQPKKEVCSSLCQKRNNISTRNIEKILQIIPWVGGIQVCINIIRLVGRYCSYLFILRTKITSLCSYFWKHHVRNRFERSNTNSGIFIWYFPLLSSFVINFWYWWTVIFIGSVHLNHLHHVS